MSEEAPYYGPRSESTLIWSPVWDGIKEALTKNDKSLSLIISPFIQTGALMEVIDAAGPEAKPQVITRWRPADLATGVSDVAVYPLLRDRGLKLYTHASLHMKLLAFDSGEAVLTTANVTGAGLGLRKNSNEELAIVTHLKQQDWSNLQMLLRQCDEITEEKYLVAKAYAEANSITKKEMPPLNFPTKQQTPFSILDLPATSSPEAFLTDYLSKPRFNNMAFLHDMDLLGLLPNLERESVYQQLRQGITTNPFICAVIGRLKAQQSASFGQVTAWVHDMCTDDPTPYRKDVKVLVGNLFRWLEELLPSIRTNIPNHSQVMYWTSRD